MSVLAKPSLLDRVMPEYEFHSRFSRRIEAGPDLVWKAVNTVPIDSLPITRLLVIIRSAGRSHLSGPVAEALPMPTLLSEEGKELVKGGVAKHWRFRQTRAPIEAGDPEAFTAFSEPGWTKAVLGIELAPKGDATVLTMETRVHATNAFARRAFRPYWLFIRAGGADLIRKEILRAAARRAESEARQSRSGG